MACRVFLIVYCVVQCIAFFFILVGTPIDQFRSKDEFSIGNTDCLTFWGFKDACYSTKYDIRTKDYFVGCPGRKSRFEAAEAFAIISIIVFLLAAIFGFIQLCCCRCLRWACLVLNIAGGVAAGVCWGFMANEYSKDRRLETFTIACLTRCGKLSEWNTYGAGFALFVVGWSLNLLNVVCILMPC